MRPANVRELIDELDRGPTHIFLGAPAADGLIRPGGSTAPGTAAPPPAADRWTADGTRDRIVAAAQVYDDGRRVA